MQQNPGKKESPRAHTAPELGSAEYANIIAFASSFHFWYATQVDSKSGSMYVRLSGKTKAATELRRFIHSQSSTESEKREVVWIALINTNVMQTPTTSEMARIKGNVSDPP